MAATESGASHLREVSCDILEVNDNNSANVNVTDESVIPEISNEQKNDEEGEKSLIEALKE